MLNRLATLTIALACSGASAALSADWIFDNGPYTRSAKTGKRVDQYQALPHVDRIPFEKFFSEDGPHPFGMDWWTDWGGGWGGYGWGGFDAAASPYMWGNTGMMGPFMYPWGMP
ncbi:MAG TPA: hypothetical protein VFE46_09055 [Pirellulales bacterium]|jgi:hypothetical protein|nr:hypothetical protein [Pirellulales bacterium]